jgi:hypothetical protein
MILACLWAGGVNAAVTVSEQILQKGQFAKAACKPDPKDPDYNECLCEADIRYPRIEGMGNVSTQDKLNAWFKQQAGQTLCEGDAVSMPVKASKADISSKTLSIHYDVTLSSLRILGFKFTDWSYTGGAHGNGSAVGVIIDLNNGRLLGALDIFSAANLDKVNASIYKALAAKPEEEVFRDQIEARKGAFIKGDECQGCTLILTPEGVHVLFQTYEVAPYGAGNTDVLIPAEYVSYASVKEALKEQKAEKSGNK